MLFSNVVLFGQSNFSQGYIIKPSQDTLFGLIEDQGEVRNTKACHFKENESSEIEIFSPEDLFAYRILKGKYYVSKEVELGGESQQVFLEYLLNGIYNLYYANVLDKERYFIENEEGKITELSNESKAVFIDETEYVRQTNRYKGILKASFVDYPELYAQIEKTSLDHKSLIEITREYHELSCKDRECVIYEKQNVPMRFRIGPSFGVYFMNLKYNGEMDEYTSDMGSNFFIGFRARLEFPRRNNSFSVEFSGDFSNLYFYNLESEENVNIDYHIYMSQVNAKIAPRYSFPISKKVRLGFLAGIQFGYYFDFDGKQVEELMSGSTVTTNYSPYEIEINAFQFGYFGGIGIEYLLKKSVIFLNADVEYIPIETETSVDSQIFGYGLSTGILF